MSNVPEVVNEDFNAWLEGQVSEVASEHDCSNARAFPAWWLRYKFEVDSDEAFDLTDTLQIGDGGIDGWYHDATNEILYIFQAKWTDDQLGKTYSRDQLDGIVLGVKRLYERYEEIKRDDNREKLWGLVSKLYHCVANGQDVKIVFLLRGEASEQAKTELVASVKDLDLGESLAEAEFVGLERIESSWLSDEGLGDLINREVRLSLASNDGTGLYYDVDCSRVEDIEKAMVCTLDGNSLGKLHLDRDVGERLFHRNVRFQLRGNKINQGMKDTLRDDSKRSSFWLYNNGLTIVCDDYRIETADGTSVLILKGPQIVNGAQTTSAIAESIGFVEERSVFVQAKIIKAAQGEKGDEQIRRIVELTNSQSVVKLADLVSNQQIHKNLQKQFREVLDPGWFYQRKRGEWESLSAAEKSRFRLNKVFRKVDKADIGTTMWAALGHPAEAVSKKDEIWSNPEVFSKSRSAAVYLLAWSIFRFFHEDLKKGFPIQPAFSNKRPNAVDDDDTYLYRIRRAQKLVNMHLVHLTWSLLEDRFGSLGRARASELQRRLDQFATDQSDPTFREIVSLIYFTFFNYLSMADATQLKQRFQEKSTIKTLLDQLDATKGLNTDWKSRVPAIANVNDEN
jgi:hypothetical protein